MKLLIVDDDELGRNSLQTLLSISGYEVHTAANCQQAIQIAETVSLDIAFIDWLLKDETNGFDVARELKQVQPNARIVIISGQLDVQHQAPTGTQYQYLLKPFNFNELMAMVNASSE